MSTTHVLRPGEMVTADSVLDPNQTGFAMTVYVSQDTRRFGGVRVSSRDEFNTERATSLLGRYFWAFTPDDSREALRLDPMWRSLKQSDSYFPYPPDDGIAFVIPHGTPVNQIPDIRVWTDRLAVFAHHLDLAHGSYTVDVELGEADRAALFQYGQMLIGHALNEMDEWAKIDPQHKFVRNNETILSWKDYEPRVENAVMAMGADHWWGRLMAEHADLPLFAVSLGHGRLQAVNQNADTWVPGAVIGQAQMPPPVGNPPVLPTPEERAIAIATWLTETAARWSESRNHYDTVVGPQEAGYWARLRDEYPI